MPKIQVTGWSKDHDDAVRSIYEQFTTLVKPAFTNPDGAINYSAVIRFAVLAEAERVKQKRNQVSRVTEDDHKENA